MKSEKQMAFIENVGEEEPQMTVGDDYSDDCRGRGRASDSVR